MREAGGELQLHCCQADTCFAVLVLFECRRDVHRNSQKLRLQEPDPFIKVLPQQNGTPSVSDEHKTLLEGSLALLQAEDMSTPKVHQAQSEESSSAPCEAEAISEECVSVQTAEGRSDNRNVSSDSAVQLKSSEEHSNGPSSDSRPLSDSQRSKSNGVHGDTPSSGNGSMEMNGHSNGDGVHEEGSQGAMLRDGSERRTNDVATDRPIGNSISQEASQSCESQPHGLEHGEACAFSEGRISTNQECENVAREQSGSHTQSGDSSLREENISSHTQETPSSGGEQKGPKGQGKRKGGLCKNTK